MTKTISSIRILILIYMEQEARLKYLERQHDPFESALFVRCKKIDGGKHYITPSYATIPTCADLEDQNQRKQVPTEDEIERASKLLGFDETVSWERIVERRFELARQIQERRLKGIKTILELPEDWEYEEVKIYCKENKIDSLTVLFNVTLNKGNDAELVKEQIRKIREFHRIVFNIPEDYDEEQANEFICNLYESLGGTFVPKYS